MAEGLLNTARKRWKGLMGDVENLSIGLGSGLASQVDSVTGLIESPIETSKQMYEGVKALAQNPSMVKGLLSDIYQRGTSGPMGFGEVLGENLSLRPRAPKNLLEMTVYHGSPYKFDKFDLGKVGSGEGAQAYGHGMYFAESPSVARQYQPSGLEIDVDMKNIPPAMDGGHSAAYTAILEQKGDIPQARESLLRQSSALRREADKYRASGKVDDAEAFMMKAQWRDEGVRLIDEGRYKAKGGQASFYTVDLPDEHIANMLDWDKPLSQQSEAVRKALADSGLMDREVAPKMKRGTLAALRRGETVEQRQAVGRDIYTRAKVKMGSAEAASDYLRSLGIPGIKYFDGNSRPQNITDARLLSLLEKHSNDPVAAVDEFMRGVYNTPKMKEALRKDLLEKLKPPTSNFVVFDPKQTKILKRE